MCNGIRVPAALITDCFPNQQLPIDLTLQLVVDGNNWGERFPTRITPSHFINTNLISKLDKLLDCRATAFRRAAGAAAFDVLLTSLPAAWEAPAGGAEEGGEEGEGEAVTEQPSDGEIEDEESAGLGDWQVDTQPVVSLGCGCSGWSAMAASALSSQRRGVASARKH